MKKLRYLVAGLVLWSMPACVTSTEDDTCDNCAGAKPDGEEPAGGTSAGGTSPIAGSSGTTVGGGSGGSAGGSAGSAGEGGAPPTLPTTVSVEVLGALIGPGKVDHTTWDGTGTVPPDILAALAVAFGYPGVDKIVDVVQQAAYQALSKPDPFGTANLNPDGAGFDPIHDVTLATELTNTDDTFKPTWPMPYPGWQDLPFTDELQVRVTLYDEDLSANDDIGTATVNYPDLLEAWQTGKSHWVRVEDQTEGQILALEIQVSGAVP